MRTVFVMFFACTWLWACDSEKSATPRNQESLGHSSSVLSDSISVDEPVSALAMGIRISSRIESTSADGSEADLVLHYRINTGFKENLSSASRLEVELYDTLGNHTVIKRAKIDTQSLQGDVSVTVPVADSGASLRVTLLGLGGNLASNLPVYGTVNLPSILHTKLPDTERLDSIHVELVKDSYSSEIVDNRRIHRFAVRVSGESGHRESETQAEHDAEGLPNSVPGLARQVAQHFQVLENGEPDVESPVSALYQRQPLAVYLVLDASRSIVENHLAENLLNAVSRAIISLADVAEFNYREFAQEVFVIPSMREFKFDESTYSGTALYYAIDTALDELDVSGSPEQDKVIIVFTDGKDKSSLNYYNAFLEPVQGINYIRNRLTNIIDAQHQFYQKQMDTFIVGLGDVDGQELRSLAMPDPDTHFIHISNDELQNDKTQNELLDEAFSGITRRIRGVYYFEYSSQQTTDKNILKLNVMVNGHSKTVELYSP